MGKITISNQLSPSILAADFTCLGESIQKADEGGQDMVHIDVMDGLFVPSISFGMPVISSIRGITDTPFDVHLMVQEPARYIDEFVECGADLITVHAEACTHLDRVIRQIKEKGKRVGVALNPATSLHVLDYIIRQVDMVLIMTVNPGFGGQKYIEESTEKIRTLRGWMNELQLTTDIQVDGGITNDNVETVLQAGANVIVAGTAVYRGDITENVKQLKKKLMETR